jgi:hypothetical protein
MVHNAYSHAQFVFITFFRHFRYPLPHTLLLSAPFFVLLSPDPHKCSVYWVHLLSDVSSLASRTQSTNQLLIWPTFGDPLSEFSTDGLFMKHPLLFFWWEKQTLLCLIKTVWCYMNGWNTSCIITTLDLLGTLGQFFCPQSYFQTSSNGLREISLFKGRQKLWYDNWPVTLRSQSRWWSHSCLKI